MKRAFALLLALSLVFIVSACGADAGPLAAIEGADADQLAGIQAVLDECGLAITACTPVEPESTGDELSDSLVSALMGSFSPYDITAEDGTVYRMTLSAEDLSVFSIAAPDGSFVYGGFGNG